MAPHTDRAKRGPGHPDGKGEPARKGEKKIEGGTVIVRKLWNEGIEEGEMAWRLSWRKPERLCSFGDKKTRGKDQKGKLWRKMKGKKRFLKCRCGESTRKICFAINSEVKKSRIMRQVMRSSNWWRTTWRTSWLSSSPAYRREEKWTRRTDAAVQQDDLEVDAAI